MNIEDRDNVDQILKEKLMCHLPDQSTPSWEMFERRSKVKRLYRALGYAGSMAAAVAAVVVAVVVCYPEVEGVDQVVGGFVRTENLVVQSHDVEEVENQDAGVQIPVVSVSKHIESEAVGHVPSADDTLSKAKINENDHTIDNIVGDQGHEGPGLKSEGAVTKSKNVGEGVKNSGVKARGRVRSIDENQLRRGGVQQLALATFTNISGGSTAHDKYDYNFYASAPYHRSLMVVNGASRELVTFEESDFSHDFPLTIGVLISIPVVDRLNIETGISYSKLRSTAEKTGENVYRQTRNSQYMGIPVSLAFKFLRTRPVDLYLTAGGMMEWSIASTTSEEILSGGRQITYVSHKTPRKSLQFSAMAAVGVNLNISKSFGIFVEPGVVHYVKNHNHPTTFHTQEDLQFNLRTGFKFRL